MEQPSIFPVPNSTLPYWRKDLHKLDSYRSTDRLPNECDVLVIGAGLSGVSTAYHLLTDNPSPPSVVLLEAREVCSGATGRNGGHLMMLYIWMEQITKAYGLEVAKELAEFTTEQVYAMKTVAEKENLDCEAVLTRCYETFLTKSHVDEREKLFARWLEDGVDCVRDAQFIGPKYAQLITGVKGAKGATSTTALQLWPYKFVTGLLARLVERTSINVQTHTPVTSITNHDGYSTAITHRGDIRAKKIVFATNAYTAGICPTVVKKIVPIKITCSHISVPKDTCHPPPHLNNTYGLNYNGPEVRDYLIPRPDGGVICGGGKESYIKDKSLWFNNVDDSTLLEQARPHFESVMQKNFIGWEKSGAAVDYLWTGIIGYTADEMPHCGLVPGHKNHFILAGYNGGGMPIIFLAAKGIAKMVKEDVPFEESGLPRIFKCTEERLVDDVVR